MKYALLAATTFAAAAACGHAQAQTAVAVVAYTAKNVNLRAGPAREYPVVAVLPAGLQVSVQGCLQTYSWCDVIAGGERGWVYAGNLSSAYGNEWQPLISWAPVIGIAVLPFVFDDYWHRHYWNRPWYPERWRWEHVPPPRHVHPRPPPRPGGMPAPDRWSGRPGQPPPPGDWPRERPGERHDGPRGGAPSQPLPRVMPAPQAQPPAPPRPPGWRPEPRVGPVPRGAHAASPAQQGQPQQQPRAAQPGQPPGREHHGPRGEHERR